MNIKETGLDSIAFCQKCVKEAHVAMVPGVAFGAAMPGRENNMHGANEFAVVDDLVISAKIFAQVIVDLCS